MMGLRDTELPVLVQAAVSLGSLLERENRTLSPAQARPLRPPRAPS